MPISEPSYVNLKIVENQYVDRDYKVKVSIPEFSCVCPRTGLPDYAIIDIHYIPDKHIIELKSLKLYLWSFRNEGAFHEKVINDILDTLVEACLPRQMEVVGDFNVRGGIHTTVSSMYEAPKRKTKAKKKK